MGRKRFRERLGRLWGQVREEVPLSSLTTLQIGGPARYLVSCDGVDELRTFLAAAEAEGLPVFVLGGGSNLLVSDQGFAGVVIKLMDGGMGLEEQGEGVSLRASAGSCWDELVALAVAAGLGGVECLSGIPGRVGAAPMQNIGAYGQEVAAVIESVQVLDRASGQSLRLGARECGFSYRGSKLKSIWRERYVVTELLLRLPRRSAGLVLYPDLENYFEVGGSRARPGLAEVREAVLEIRRGKSMLLDPKDPNSRSAGSFFVNPVVSAEVAAAVARAYGGDRPPPAFPSAEGWVKLSAAWLIEQAGFRRGSGEGRVGFSTRHVLALINRGGASASELLALAARVHQRVRDRWAVSLVPEPRFLGFDAPIAELLGTHGLGNTGE